MIITKTKPVLLIKNRTMKGAHMTDLTSLSEADDFIEKNQFSFIYVSRTNCGVCHALLPQVEEMLKEYPHTHLGHINADEVEEVAGRLSIFTVPALLLSFEGKDMIRVARLLH